MLSDTSSIRLPDQLQNALEQHAIAYSSADLKVNLWIALETLVGRSKTPSSVIGRITEYVTPCVVSYRIREQIKYISISLHDFGFNKSVPDKSGFFEYSLQENKIIPNELSVALAGKGGSNVQDELCKAVLCHPLLLFRLHLFWEQLGFKKEKSRQLSDPIHFKKQLEKSYQRTEWQLRRIYRARNLVVHQGIEKNEFPYLLENLKYYFSTTVQRIINEFRRHPNWTVDECFEYKRIQYKYLIHSLKMQYYRVYSAKETCQIRKNAYTFFKL